MANNIPIVQYADQSGNKAYALTHWNAIDGKPNDASFIRENLILNSSAEMANSLNELPVIIGATNSTGRANITFQDDGTTIINNSTTREFYYQLVTPWFDITKTPIIGGQTYTFSANLKSSTKQVALWCGYITKDGIRGEPIVYFDVSASDWTSITAKIKLPKDTATFFIRLSGAIDNTINGEFTGGENFSFNRLKMEVGQTATAWQPAINDKANDYAVVHKLGNEKVGGFKEFTDGAAIISGNYGIKVTPIGIQRTSDGGNSWLNITL